MFHLLLGISYIEGSIGASYWKVISFVLPSKHVNNTFVLHEVLKDKHPVYLVEPGSIGSRNKFILFPKVYKKLGVLFVSLLIILFIMYSTTWLVGLFQMTCVRLLEMFPVVFERLNSKALKLSGTSDTSMPHFYDFKWLNDLMDWGKSSLVVLRRHWKQCFLSLLNILQVSCHVNSARIIMDIETLISCGEPFYPFPF